MRRIAIPCLVLLSMLALAAAALADPGDKGKGKAQGKNKFTFKLANTDNRCDGSGAWANLNETRTYQVHDNGDGTFRLRRVDKGMFTTLQGTSPGNSTDCKFNFNYTASNRAANRPRLLVRHWQDRGKGAGTMLQEVFHGDIASS